MMQDSLIIKVLGDFEEQKKAAHRINIKRDCIVIREDTGFDYEIPLSDCETVTGALKWLHHMAEKINITEADLWRIAECMVAHDSGERHPW